MRRRVGFAVRGPVTVAVTHGVRGEVGDLVLPASGVSLASARSMARRFAEAHADELGARPSSLERSAFRAVADAVDAALGNGPSSPRSLRCADLKERAFRRS